MEAKEIERLVAEMEALKQQVYKEARDFETALLRRTERLNSEVDELGKQLNRIIRKNV